MKPHLPILLAILSLLTLTARGIADEKDDKIKALEARVEALEKHLEGKAGIGPESPKAVPSLSIGSSGFIMRSADTNFSLRLRGLLQVDTRSYVDDGGISDNDTFLVRRARPILEGTVFRDSASFSRPSSAVPHPPFATRG